MWWTSFIGCRSPFILSALHGCLCISLVFLSGYMCFSFFFVFVDAVLVLVYLFVFPCFQCIPSSLSCFPVFNMFLLVHSLFQSFFPSLSPYSFLHFSLPFLFLLLINYLQGGPSSFNEDGITIVYAILFGLSVGVLVFLLNR